MENKLAFVQWTNNFGGLERITADYEKIYSALNPVVVPLVINKNGIEYKNTVEFNQKSKIQLYWQYYQFVRKNRDIIFHLQYTGTKILMATIFAGARKIVYHFHGTQFPDNSFEKFIWNKYRENIKIIANSNHTKSVIKSKYNINDYIEVIPNYIDSGYFRFNEKKPSPSKFIITYAGRFIKGKNIDVIIETAKYLLGKDPNIEFRLYGDGLEKRKIEQLIENYRLKENILLPGYAADMISVYQNCHLFLFLSSYESFGNVVAEAILSGTPALCYKIPALNEMIKDELFFVNTLNPEEIADKILFMKEHYDLISGRLKLVYKKLSNYLDNCTITNNLQLIYDNFNCEGKK